MILVGRIYTLPLTFQLSTQLGLGSGSGKLEPRAKSTAIHLNSHVPASSKTSSREIGAQWRRCTNTSHNCIRSAVAPPKQATPVPHDPANRHDRSQQPTDVSSQMK